METLKRLMKDKPYEIVNATNKGPNGITELTKKLHSQKNKVIFVMKTRDNYEFFSSLDRSTEGNNRYYIYHCGNYATWLNDDDITEELIDGFLNQSAKTLKVEKRIDMNNLGSSQTGIKRDGKSISLGPSIKIL